jgi:hypothetical protein
LEITALLRTLRATTFRARRTASTTGAIGDRAQRLVARTAHKLALPTAVGTPLARTVANRAERTIPKLATSSLAHRTARTNPQTRASGHSGNRHSTASLLLMILTTFAPSLAAVAPSLVPVKSPTAAPRPMAALAATSKKPKSATRRIAQRLVKWAAGTRGLLVLRAAMTAGRRAIAT